MCEADDVVCRSRNYLLRFGTSPFVGLRIYGVDLLSLTPGTASNKSNYKFPLPAAFSPPGACVSSFMFASPRDCRVIFHNLIITPTVT